MCDLTLFSRFHCHLCQDMHQQLLQLQAESGFRLEVIDIDTDPMLVAKYNDRVPVLVSGEQLICEYFLDMVVLKQVLHADSG
ncbi:MAG: glutaredoxin family protein [Gammaproteobacteria bacterium]